MAYENHVFISGKRDGVPRQREGMIDTVSFQQPAGGKQISLTREDIKLCRYILKKDLALTGAFEGSTGQKIMDAINTQGSPVKTFYNAVVAVKEENNGLPKEYVTAQKLELTHGLQTLPQAPKPDALKRRF